jgi:hypothetical protein
MRTESCLDPTSPQHCVRMHRSKIETLKLIPSGRLGEDARVLGSRRRGTDEPLATKGFAQHTMVLSEELNVLICVRRHAGKTLTGDRVSPNGQLRDEARSR